MAPPKNHSPATYYICSLVLSTAALSFSIVTASESTLCTIPSPVPMLVAAGKDTLPFIHSFQLSAGYFFGGEDIHFAKDASDDSLFYVPRSLSLLPLKVDRTTDFTVNRVAATLTLSGGRAYDALAAHQRRNRFGGSHSVSFHLDGYYSSIPAELCMVGSGTYSLDDGWLKHLPDVVLRLRVPNPLNLSDPFVTGNLMGVGFEAISLVAYAEGDRYRYGEHASCPPLRPSSSTARGAQQALGANFSCPHLKEQLVSSYKLQYGGRVHASSTSPPLLRLQEPRMHVGQVQCTADGAVRAYATFSNNTNMWGMGHLQPGFMIKEEAVVAEGRWDSARSMLCLRACRVVRSGPMSLAVKEHECGIGMSFWFPVVWTIRDRSIVAGTLWNSSHGTGGSNDAAANVISASSIDFDNHRSNFSDVKYNYTMVEVAKQRYFIDVLSNHKNKAKGSFPGANYTYHDFKFRFLIMNNDDSRSGHGDAYPVTMGSVMVYGDRLAVDNSFSRQAVIAAEHELLIVSYDIHTLHYLLPTNWVHNKNGTVDERQITAEGIYDPKTGILCMIGCREINGSTDCQILITVQFASLDAKAQGNGRGVISILRSKTDLHFFEKMDISLYGMYTEQVSESISRMDLESVMLVASTTLSCFFTALQILHAKRNPEASVATSITMLVVLALGSVSPLVISSDVLFASRRTQYAPFSKNLPYELSQVMLRVPTVIAFVLQLRLLQLAWSGRRSATDRSTVETSSAAERRALWTCLPLYFLGGAFTIVLHMMNDRRTARENSLTVRVGPEPATLWEDLLSSAGLALDGFLLPQVVMNVFLGAGVRAISPWYYVGGTVVRAMPHVYDVIRAQGYVPSVKPSYVYASPCDDRFGAAWDIFVPCVGALLALLLFLQQRPGGNLLLRSRRRLGEYEMVSTL